LTLYPKLQILLPERKCKTYRYPKLHRSAPAARCVASCRCCEKISLPLTQVHVVRA